ncbi:SAM-dependent methyltransferase [Candidatus Bathyarchaeota archaeon]|nr:SAM-dependent methyltransferase [Candidatus Bathyarchaeota archaeon]
MANWAITTKNDLVLDPCCGDSSLLEKAIERLLELGSTTNSALENVYGIEINKRTTYTAFANIFKKFNSNAQHLITKDFLKVVPYELPKFNAILCNPPYKRHHNLSRTYKDYILKRILRDIGIVVPRTSSLYLHFFFYSSQFLADEGRMIFLTPSQYLNNKFGAVLRDFLVDKFHLYALVLFDEKISIFPDVMSTACFTLLKKGTPNEDDEVMLIKIDSISKIPELRNALKGKIGANLNIQKISQKKLRENFKWSTFFQPTYLPEYAIMKLQDLATTKRGIATGANNFFVLTNENISELGLERRFLIPVLAKAQNAPYFDFKVEDWMRLKDKGKKTWLFSCGIPKDELISTNALRYIEEGERLKYHKRYLTSHRQPWYRLEKRVPSKIIVTYMSNGNPRFIYNESQILTLNVFHSVYLKEDICKNDNIIKALLSYLNSSSFRSMLPYLGRVYFGGLLKIEPGDVQKMPVLDIGQLPNNTLMELSGFFDKSCKQYRKNRIWDTNEIDETLKSIEWNHVLSK